MKNKIISSYLLPWLNNTPIQRPIDRRMAALLQVILIGFMAIIVIASGMNLIIAQNISWQAILIPSGIVILIVGFPLILLRRGHFHASVIIIIVIFLSLETFAITLETLREVAETLTFFTLAIILAGLLVGGRTLTLTFLWSAGVVGYRAFQEQNAGLGNDGVIIASNFILLNGLMSVFLYHFGVTLRTTLADALARENELQNEIANRGKVEEALRESQELLTLTIHSANVGLWDWDLRTNKVYYSPEWKSQLGYEDHEISNDFSEWETRIHPDNLEPAKKTVGAYLEKPYPNYQNEFRMLHKDGSYRWILAQASLIHDVEGKPIRMMGSHIDITKSKQAEDSAYEQRVRQQSILDSMFVFVGLFSLGGIVLEINHAALSVTGMDLKEIIGKPLADLPVFSYSESTRTQVQEALQKAAAGEMVRDDFLVLVAGKQIILVDIIFTPLRDSSGQIIQIVGSGVDVTARKEAEDKLKQQNQRLKVLREIDSAILSADSIENIVGAALGHVRGLIDCRRASLTLIDWEANETLVFDISTASGSIARKGKRLPLAPFHDMVQTLSNHQIILINDLNALPNPPAQIQPIIQEGLRASCTLPLFSQSRLIGTFNMLSETPGFFDEEKINLGREVANQVAIAITQNRLTEALQHLNVDLEQRVQKRTAELELANKELDAFSYSVSHDLRAPLRAIGGFSQLIMEKHLSQLPEEVQYYLDQIQKGNDRMSHLINDLLQLSRATRQELRYEIVNLSELAYEITDELKNSSNGRVVEFKIAEGLAIRADARLMQIVMENLLNNAWKYTSKCEQASIEFGSLLQSYGKLAFFVRDNGAGFDMAYADKLFGAFQRLHSEFEFEGTGIGLATVHRIISRHGGRVWAEGEVEKGATFYFVI